MLLKWRGLLVVGIVLIAAGIFAIALPEISTFATGTVFGTGLAIVGAVKMVQSFQLKDWSGFIWQELSGAVEFVGGILIYLSPLKGALAIALLIALVLLVQGILQLGIAARIYNQRGWYWFVIAGFVSVASSAILVIKIPYLRDLDPGVVAGTSLIVAGVAHVMIGLTVRKAPEG